MIEIYKIEDDSSENRDGDREGESEEEVDNEDKEFGEAGNIV